MGCPLEFLRVNKGAFVGLGTSQCYDKQKKAWLKDVFQLDVLDLTEILQLTGHGMGRIKVENALG